MPASQLRSGSARAEALAALSRLLRFGGDQPLAAELARQALAEAGPDDRVRAEAAQGLAATLFFMRERPPGGSRARHARRRARGAVARRRLAHGVGLPSGSSGVPGGKPAGGRHAAERSGPGGTGLLRARGFDAHEQPGRLRSLDRRSRGCPAPAGRPRRRRRTRRRGIGRDGARESRLGRVSRRPLERSGSARRGRLRGCAFSPASGTTRRSHSPRGRSSGAPQGDDEGCRADAAEAIGIAGERAVAVARIHALSALGVLELSLGHAEEAASLIRRATRTAPRSRRWRAWLDPLRPRRDRGACRARADGRGRDAPRLARGARPRARPRLGARRRGPLPRPARSRSSRHDRGARVLRGGAPPA